MIEFLRFGAAWLAVLFLAGLTSLPPNPHDFSCCSQPVQDKEVPYSQWMSEQINGYASQITRLLETEAKPAAQPALCHRMYSGAWARVTDDNQQHPNGFFLSRFCDAQEVASDVFGLVNQGDTWSDGTEAVNVMYGEVQTGMGTVYLGLESLITSCKDAALGCINLLMAVDLGGLVSNIAAFFYGISLFNMVVYAVNFLTKNLLQIQLPNMSLFSNLSPSSMALGVASGAIQTLQAILQVIYLFPLFYPRYGLATLVSSVFMFTIATLTDAVSTCLNILPTDLTPTITMVNSATSDTCGFMGCMFSSTKIGAILHDCFWAVWVFLGAAGSYVWPILAPAHLVETIVAGFRGLFFCLEVLYNICDTNQYLIRIFRAMFYGLGNYLLIPLVTGLAEVIAFGTIMVANYLINPVAAVFIYLFSGVLTPAQLRQIALYIAQFTHEIQGLVILSLKGMVVAVDRSNELLQNFAELYAFGHEETTTVEDPSSHIPSYGRLTDIALLGVLWTTVFLVYKFAPALQQVMQRPVTTSTEDNSQTRTAKQYIVQRSIARHFYAVTHIKSDENYRYFHMVSKKSKAAVFLKCLRTGSSRYGKIGLAKECRATQTLSHSNIVCFLTWIRAGPVCALGVEFTPLGNLKHAMSSTHSKFSLKDRLGVFKQVLEAVNCLHTSRGAHLNIRPASVLVFDRWSSIKLTGFTHVVRVTSDDTCTQYNLHHVAGPTEVIIRRQPYNPFKADSWALGSLLFFIITGEFLHNKSDKPVPAILLPALKECDIRHQKIILGQLTGLLYYDPKLRPLPYEVLKTLKDMD